MATTDYNTERLVALVLLDHSCTRSELDAELEGIDTRAVYAALSSLARQRVVVIEGERVSASHCARRLDELGLICV